MINKIYNILLKICIFQPPLKLVRSENILINSTHADITSSVLGQKQPSAPGICQHLYSPEYFDAADARDDLLSTVTTASTLHRRLMSTPSRSKLSPLLYQGLCSSLIRWNTLPALRDPNVSSFSPTLSSLGIRSSFVPNPVSFSPLSSPRSLCATLSADYQMIHNAVGQVPAHELLQGLYIALLSVL